MTLKNINEALQKFLDSIFKFITKITNNLTKRNLKSYIYLYIIIVIVSLCYLINYRNYKLADIEIQDINNNTKRNHAIEKFKNFKSNNLKKIEDEKCPNINTLLDDKKRSKPDNLNKNFNKSNTDLESENLLIYSDLSALLENNIRQSPNSNENKIKVLKDNGLYIVRSLINETINKLKNILINDIKGTDTNPGINYNNYYNKEEDILCFHR